MTGVALVVDGDSLHLAQTTRAMADAGYTVLVAATFDDANRHIAATEALAVIVADVQLGEYNGIHAAFRARARFPDVAVVITHDRFDSTLETETARMAGMYCVKPVAAGRVAAFLRTHAGAAEAASGHETRRWPRKQLDTAIGAAVGHRDARLRDISYGGVCFELEERSGSLPATMDVVVPTFGVTLQIHPVWSRPAPSSRAWLCGAEVVSDDQQAGALWRRFVDRLAARIDTEFT